jgi:hypothetical protein
MTPEKLFHELLGLGLNWEVTESRVREEAVRSNPKARPGLNCPVATTVNLIQ